MKKVTSGDTIIEVLLALAVIGMVIAAAFGIANRGIMIGQSAQERSEAVKIAESQLEFLRARYPYDSGLRNRTENQPFCFDLKTPEARVKDASDAACNDINQNGSLGFFRVSITPPQAVNDPTGAHEIKVTWARIGTSSRESENDVVRIDYVVGDYRTAGIRPSPPTPPAAPPVNCNITPSLDTYTYANRVQAGNWSEIIRMVDVYLLNPVQLPLLSSQPDFLIEPNFNIADSCLYTVTSTSQCRVPGQFSPISHWSNHNLIGNCGTNDPDEAMRISFYANYTGTEAARNVSCSGTRIGYFETSDNSLLGLRWDETPVFNRQATGTVRCMEIEHVCKPGLSPAYTASPLSCNRDSSVYFVGFQLSGRSL